MFRIIEVNHILEKTLTRKPTSIYHVGPQWMCEHQYEACKPSCCVVDLGGQWPEKFLGWGRCDTIVWLGHSSDMKPKEQLWMCVVMYLCISCRQNYRQVWGGDPRGTHPLTHQELANTHSFSLLIKLEWCETLCLTSFPCWKNINVEEAKTAVVIIYPSWSIWIKALSRTEWPLGTKLSGPNTAVIFFRQMASRSALTAPLWAPLSPVN